MKPFHSSIMQMHTQGASNKEKERIKLIVEYNLYNICNVYIPQNLGIHTL